VGSILSVYRDGVLYCRAELTAAGLRIGRGAENHVVLEDSLKRVSRAHAELSIDEHGLVTLSDLNSANGTLIDGSPITSVELHPGQPFNVGPYVLTWDRLEHVPSGLIGEVTTSASMPGASQAITVLPSSDVPAKGVRTQPAPPQTVSRGWRRHRTAYAVAAVVVLALVSAAALLVRSGASSGDQLRAQLTAARTLIADGRPVVAIARLDALLAEHPDHQEARQIRAQAQAMIQAPIITPPEAPQGDSTGLRLEPPPGSPEPTVGQAPIETRASTRPVPAYPLLERRRGESIGSWHDRSRAASEDYAKAAAAEENQQYEEAIGRFEQLEAAVPGYRDVSARREAAKAAQQGLARDLLKQGQEEERRGAFPEALVTYERARQIAPAFSGLTDRIAAVRAMKSGACQKAYDDGLNYYNAGRLRDAGEHLTRALALCDAGSPQHRDSAELMRAMEHR